MPHATPFSPDDQYCAYCHALAAGMCASCNALCCGDCVDLVMGLTTRRAVCHDCLGKGRRSGDAALRPWLLAAAVGLLTVGTLCWLLLCRSYP